MWDVHAACSHYWATLLPAIAFATVALDSLDLFCTGHERSPAMHVTRTGLLGCERAPTFRPRERGQMILNSLAYTSQV